MVYLLSSDKYVAQYEIDLVKVVNLGERGIFGIGIMEKDNPEIDVDLKVKKLCCSPLNGQWISILTNLT